MSEAEALGRTVSKAGTIPRVLVLDDEADLRELIELTLVGMGLDVDCAADLAQARQLLGQHGYALCLTDMRLPDGDGLELVQLISESHPNTPVAVITAYGSAENAVAALKAGAFDYLAKPIALDALRNLVRSAVRMPGTGWCRQTAKARDRTRHAACLGDSGGNPRRARTNHETGAQHGAGGHYR